MIKKSGSVRIDLVGGTLDLWPINLVLDQVITINFATSLQAEVELIKNESTEITIISEDYQTKKRFDITDLTEENFRSDFFGPFRFIAELISCFELTHGFELKTRSGSPAGAGLGGSSTMGVVVYRALCELTNQTLEKKEIIEKVATKEARILNCGPTGYQDYFPALYNGVLALHARSYLPEVEQLYSEELSRFLETHMTLVYSGDTRLSGLTNWEVFKGFFDKNPSISGGLKDISRNAKKAYQSLKEGDFIEFLYRVRDDGDIRTKLFPNFTTPKMIEIHDQLKTFESFIGLKVCGAGGGGCFLLLHEPELKDEISNIVSQKGMQILDFSINIPK